MFGPEETLCGTSLKEKQGEQETRIKLNDIQERYHKMQFA